MKSKLVLSVLVLVLSCLIGWGGYAQGQRGNSMKQTWEYKVTSIAANTEDAVLANQLNQLGADGWELAGVSEWNQLLIHYLKRAK